jgi:hypothetical protein
LQPQQFQKKCYLNFSYIGFLNFCFTAIAENSVPMR